MASNFWVKGAELESCPVLARGILNRALGPFPPLSTLYIPHPQQPAQQDVSKRRVCGANAASSHPAARGEEEAEPPQGFSSHLLIPGDSLHFHRVSNRPTGEIPSRTQSGSLRGTLIWKLCLWQKSQELGECPQAEPGLRRLLQLLWTAVSGGPDSPSSRG